jgi:hypothetical protein
VYEGHASWQAFRRFYKFHNGIGTSPDIIEIIASNDINRTFFTLAKSRA